jgi:hypothetical protein
LSKKDRVVDGTVHAPLRAAERDPGHRRLPGHERREGADLIDVHLRVEADAAFVGAAGAVVLDPVAGVDVDLAVGLLDRDLNGDLAVGRPEHDAEVIRKLQAFGREVEVVANDLQVGQLGALPWLAIAVGLRLGHRLLDRLGRFVRMLPFTHGAGRRPRLWHRDPPVAAAGPILPQRGA